MIARARLADEARPARIKLRVPPQNRFSGNTRQSAG
jgi:hypothetical protein